MRFTLLGTFFHSFCLLKNLVDCLQSTFSNEDALPPLPLPQLDDTLDLYLETTKPHLSESELRTTEDAVNKGGDSIVYKLCLKIFQTFQ